MDVVVNHPKQGQNTRAITPGQEEVTAAITQANYYQVCCCTEKKFVFAVEVRVCLCDINIISTGIIARFISGMLG